MKKDNSIAEASIRFRAVSGRVLRANRGDVDREIRRLIQFVETTPVLKAAIDAAPRPSPDEVAEQWVLARKRHRHVTLPDDEDAEFGFLHVLLVGISENDGSEFWQKCHGYAGLSGNIEETIETFINDVVLKYVRHLSRILDLATYEQSEPGVGAARVIHLEMPGTGHQVNIASDQATISANQHNREELKEVVRLARELRQAASEAQPEQRADAEEIADLIIDQSTKAKPSRLTLKTIESNLASLANTAESGSKLATAAIAAAPHISHWIEVLKHASGK